MSNKVKAWAMALVVGILSGSLTPLIAEVAEFHADGFQAGDGAIVLTSGGDYVEPYFATKALIVAQDAGVNIGNAAGAWIGWALSRQTSHGLFRRYCRSGDRWRDCAPADADDAMLALWMQLLYRLAPVEGMPAAWRWSVARSRSQLEKLRNRRLGVYHVSRRNHAALLMDNVEVYAALKDIAQAQSRLHEPAAAETEAQALQLAKSIQRVFWDRRLKRFRPSIEKSRKAFYPDAVAQVYPWLADMTGPGQNARHAWEQWKKTFGRGWIERRYDNHPWGLVALAAEKLGDANTAACWTSQADSLRRSASWNVLEEAAWQALRAHFSQLELLDPHNCTSFLAQR
jgi:hypothetical protein